MNWTSYGQTHGAESLGFYFAFDWLQTKELEDLTTTFPCKERTTQSTGFYGSSLLQWQ